MRCLLTSALTRVEISTFTVSISTNVSSNGGLCQGFQVIRKFLLTLCRLMSFTNTPGMNIPCLFTPSTHCPDLLEPTGLTPRCSPVPVRVGSTGSDDDHVFGALCRTSTAETQSFGAAWCRTFCNSFVFQRLQPLALTRGSVSFLLHGHWLT